MMSQAFKEDSIDCSNQVPFSWVETGGGLDDDVVNDVDTDDSGNIFVTGYFRGSMNFQDTTVNSAGGKDFFLAKLDSDGNLVWIETGGGPEDDYGTGVVVDGNDDVLVTGTFDGAAQFSGNLASPIQDLDIFLIKYSNSGVYDWGQFMGGFDIDVSGGICVDNYNNPIIVGTYISSLAYRTSIASTNYEYVVSAGNATGDSNFFVAKLDASGNFLWVTEDGSAVEDYGKDVACDNSNNLYVSGEFEGTIIFGSLEQTAAGAKDIFIAKYNQSGNVQWIDQIGTSGDNDHAYSVATDFFGNSYISYQLDQVSDHARVNRYNVLGANDLIIKFGGTGTVVPSGLAVDNSESIFISGSFSDIADLGDGDITSIGESDYFVVKYNDDGSFGFQDIAGSLLSDQGTSICLDHENSVIVGGFCNSDISFGGDSPPSYGIEDVLVTKYESYFSFGDIIISSINCDAESMCIGIEVLGGEGNLDYYWSNGETVEDICGLSLGDYQIIVTDDNNCFIETRIKVEPPELPEITTLPSVLLNQCPNVPIVLDAGDEYVSWNWSDGSHTQSINVTEEGSYYVTVYDSNSCSAEAETYVDILPDISIWESEFTLVCPGVDWTYTLTGFTEYEWHNGSTDSTYLADSPELVSVVLLQGECYFYDEIQVLHYEEISVNVGVSDKISVCDGDSILVYADPSDFVSYLWTDGTSVDSCWISAEDQGAVSLNVVDLYGCMATDDIEVEVDTPAYVDLGNDTTVCTNNVFTLIAGDPDLDYNYDWSTGEVDNVIDVSTSDTIWVSVITDAGCVTNDTIILTIHELPDPELGEDKEFCEGEQETISLPEYFSYEWSDGTIANSVVASETGMFSVTVTNRDGCEGYDTVFIHEHVIADPFLGLDTTLCVGDIYELSPPFDFENYSWSDGTKMPSIIVTQAGYYGVTVSDDLGCSATASLYIDYAGYPTITSVESGGAQMVVTAVDGTMPYVYSHDGDTWQTDNVFRNFPPGYYVISVMDDNYCLVTWDTYLDGSVDVPSFFTPNGDGYNDYWVISGLFNYPTAEVQVYDRFGKKLFEFNGNELGWDGTYMGRPLPSDTYWYAIRLEVGLHSITGHVTIKR